MTAPSRRVRRLRLSAPDPALIQRGAFLFEDALRVADLPEADGGRLLLIRALNVGTIGPQGGSVPLARVLAHRVHRCASAAVHGGNPAAGASGAVYFQDRAEAATLLARRLATSDRLDAWFWPLAVPDWRPELDRSTALRTVLLATLEIPGGVATASKLVLDLAARGNLAPLLRALRPADGDGLLRACGWARGPRQVDGRPAPSLNSPDHSGWSIALDLALDSWGGEDARTLWLACALLAGERPELALDRRLPDRARRIVEAAERRAQASRRAERVASAPRSASTRARSPGSDAWPSPGAVEETSDQDSPASEDGLARLPTRPTRQARPNRQRQPSHPPAARRPGAVTAIPGDDPSTEVLADSPEAEPAASPRPRGGAPSAVAGLLFLLPVMQRLGIESFVEAHPGLTAWAVPARVLRLLAQRLGAPGDDPLLAVLSPSDPPDPPTSFDFTAPLAWRDSVIQRGRPIWRHLRRENYPAQATPRVLVDPSGRLPLALRGGRLPNDLELLVGAWLTAVRRWCRRRAGLGLFDLVRRSGQVLTTPTHVDVVFDYRHADPRIRRAGLDQDQGWLPWLGRVVQFHYHGGESPDG